METENNKFFDKEMMFGMFGAIGKNLKRVITILAFLGLITLNVLTLASSTIHGLLYGALSSIPIASMSELLTNSPTEKNKRATSELKKKNTAIKQKVKVTTSSIKKRTAKTVAVNVGSMFTEALPYIGIATIIGATTYEVSAACMNMKEIDDLLKSIEIEENSSETHNICGQDIPGEETIRNSILASKDKYSDFQNNLGGLLNEYKDKSTQAWDSFSNALGGTLDEMLH